MKPYNLNDKSLHWRLASVYGPVTDSRVYYGQVDTCSYNRAVFWGFLATVAITLVSSLVGYGLMDWVLWAYVNLMGGDADQNPGALFFSVGVCMSAALAALAGVAITYEKYKEQQRNAEGYKDKEPGYLKLAYTSWKEKHCTVVKLAGQKTYQDKLAEDDAKWRDSVTAEIVEE